MLAQFYPYLLFIHIVSALVLFAGEGAGLLALRALRKAQTPAGVRSALARAAEASRWPHNAAVLLFLSGFSMALLVWGFQRVWVDVALVVFFLIGLQVSVVDGPRFKRLARSSREGSDRDLLEAAHDPALIAWTKFRIGATLSLVYLMSLKPAPAPSILGVALILLVSAGVAFGPLLARRTPREAASAPSRARARLS
jgi:uncharacterized membrane protein